MYKFLATLTLVAATLTPFISYAALTDAQMQSVLSLLSSFGVEQSTMQDVQYSLSGTVLGARVACPALSTSLQRGMSDATTGGQVTELQKFLAAYYGLNEQDVVSGYFGVVTQRAVVRFQTEQGISPIGIVGAQTRAKIASVCAGGSAGTTPILKPGPICPAIAYMPIECATGSLMPRYDAKGCQSGWVCSPTATTTVSLSASLDASSPAYKLVAAGTNDVVIGAFKFRAGGESILVQKIALKLTSGVPGDLVKVSVYDGPTKVGDGFFFGPTTSSNITLLSNVLVPKDTDKVLTIKGDFSLIGTGETVTVSGHLVQVDFQSGQGVGTTSGTIVNATGSTAVAGVRVAKSFPTVTDISSTLTPGGLADGRLMRFKVTADSHGTIGLGRFALAVSPNSASLGVTNITLYAFEDSNFSTPASGTGSSDGMIPATDVGSWWPSPASPIQVPAGATRYFEVRGTVSGITSGSSVTTTLLGDSAYSGIGIYSIQKEKGYFIWSPNSISQSVKSDNDWTNGYGVSGLPAVGLSHTRGSVAALTPFITSFIATPSSVIPGQSVTLSWSASNISTGGGCQIYYFAGDVWEWFRTRVAGSSGSTSFVPARSGSYKVRCYSGPGESPYAEKSVTVMVSSVTPTTTPPTITVTAPNGGEQWELGTMNTITWSPYGYNPDVNPSKDVKAYLEKIEGTSYVVVGTVLPSGKASIHWEGDIDTFGKYPPPGVYYIRVVNTVTGQSDRSNAPFIILPRSVDLKLNGSDGPVTVDSSIPVTATWTSSNVARCELHNAYTDATRQTMIGSVPLSGTRVVYTHGSAGPTLYCYRSDGAARYDSVQINVLPSVASVRVVSPNGGEQIMIGEPYNISWAQAGIKNVSIALYSNDQWKDWIVKDFPTQFANDSYIYQWRPAQTDTGIARFKIYITGTKADGSGYVDDKSDTAFSFVSPIVKPPVACPLVTYTPVVCSGTTVPVYDANGCLTGIRCQATTVDTGTVRQPGGTGNQLQ